MSEDNEFLKLESNKLNEENEKLKIEVDLTEIENKTLKGDSHANNCDNVCMKELEKLRNENAILKASLNYSKATIAKFTEGEKNLNTLLGKRRYNSNECRIGYSGNNKCQSNKTCFVKAIYGTCNYCGKVCHIA